MYDLPLQNDMAQEDLAVQEKKLMPEASSPDFDHKLMVKFPHASRRLRFSVNNRDPTETCNLELRAHEKKEKETLLTTCVSNQNSILQLEAKYFNGSQISKICRRKGRAILTDEKAQEIFARKSDTWTNDKDAAAAIASEYGVSVKTVRDIWIGRTWYRSTYHLDAANPPALERLLKKIGRPKGARDKKPRAIGTASGSRPAPGTATPQPAPGRKAATTPPAGHPQTPDGSGRSAPGADPAPGAADDSWLDSLLQRPHDQLEDLVRNWDVPSSDSE